MVTAFHSHERAWKEREVDKIREKKRKRGRRDGERDEERWREKKERRESEVCGCVHVRMCTCVVLQAIFVYVEDIQLKKQLQFVADDTHAAH